MTCPECGAGGAVDDRFCETCGARLPDPRDRVEVDRPGVAGVSDRGRHHPHNEDALAVRVRPGARVAVLCDGVSSAPRPDLASAAAAEAAADVLAAALEAADGACDLAEALRSAAAAAQKAVAELTADLPSGPACTFVAAVVSGGSATVGWIGDSRAYWLPDGAPGVLLTADDSWLAHTIAAGADVAVAARDPRAHTITAWLGADAPTLDVHVTTVAPEGPGTLVLCTDGLWNYHEAPTALAAELPADAACDPLGAARALVAAALRRGGRDNITVAVLPLPEGAS
jgi:serine/threonine protein phosphatase PrpC